MGITAKELARKLNLSAAAVSMALNHKPGVSTATRQLVLDAAEKYGYDFSRIAEKHTTSGAIYFVRIRSRNRLKKFSILTVQELFCLEQKWKAEI